MTPPHLSDHSSQITDHRPQFTVHNSQMYYFHYHGATGYFEFFAQSLIEGAFPPRVETPISNRVFEPLNTDGDLGREGEE